MISKNSERNLVFLRFPLFWQDYERAAQEIYLSETFKSKVVFEA